MLRQISDTYFNDHKLDATNMSRFTLPLTMDGPNHIVRLREEAARDRRNPDTSFRNAELEVAKDIGQETVCYVTNSYEYYVAYKFVLEQSEQRQKERQSS